MEDQEKNSNRNITLNDVQLAAAYYPILIDLAKHKHCLTYGELVELAKEENPEKEVVQNAIAVSTGRKLDIVRRFTNERDLPDVTSLIINKSEGECGIGFTSSFDPKAARNKVYEYDWDDVSSEFDVFIDEVKANATPKKRRTRKESLKLTSSYYQENKAAYSKSIKDLREEIVILLMEGFGVEESFKEINDSILK